MSMLVDGKWQSGDATTREVAKDGRFKRTESAFRNWVTADGSSGFAAEPGRYHLYAAYSCPWAHRALMFRKLKKLDTVVSVSIAAPGMREQGWTYVDHPDFPEVGPDTVVTERITRVSRDELSYQFTVEDPTYYTQPWKGETRFQRSDERMLEYACHEGNYSLAYVLKAARAVEGGGADTTEGSVAVRTLVSNPVRVRRQ